MMNNIEFVEKLKNVCNKKTLYVMGCFGAPLGYGNNRSRYINNYSYNKNTTRKNMINNASGDTFGFDCVCLGKGILWGWCGDTNKVYGGAEYCSNGVPDFGTESIKKYCNDWSTDFNNIEIGEWLYMKGHCGYYIGNGEVIECTPAWKNKVQITKLSWRKWLGHGKIKFLDYVKGECEMGCPYWKNGVCTKNVDTRKSNEEIAREVIQGKWGNGADRKNRLANAGYDYGTIQNIVNNLLK